MFRNCGTTRPFPVTVEANISQLQDDVSGLQDYYEQAQQDISNLQTEVGQIEDDVTTLQTDMTNVQQNISELQNEMTQVKDDIVNLQDGVNNIEAEINNINDEITTIQDELAVLTEGQFVGTWSATKAYSTGQTVAYITNVYKALQDNIGQEPALSPTYWQETGPFEINGGGF